MTEDGILKSPSCHKRKHCKLITHKVITTTGLQLSMTTCKVQPQISNHNIFSYFKCKIHFYEEKSIFMYVFYFINM